MTTRERPEQILLTVRMTTRERPEQILLIPDPEGRYTDAPRGRLWHWIEVPPVMAHESLNLENFKSSQ